MAETLEFEVKKPDGPGALVVHNPTPLTLLERAIAQGVPIEQLERLQQMHERWEANEAHKAFQEAMNAFKSDAPEITKNKEVRFGTTAYKHATLDHVVDAITERLSQHGITYRWRTEQEKDWIRVTCILAKGIYSEETTLGGPADVSGPKNAIQAIASTVTYLERYTLLAATGLAAADSDNDGAGSPKYAELAERMEWIQNCKDITELQKVFSAAYKAARAVNDQEAMKRIIAAKDRRRGELQ